MISDNIVTTPAVKQSMQEAINYLRMFLRDFPELNRLIKGLESNDRMLAWSIEDTIDDWNSTPPFIGNVAIQNFPSKSLLRMGAAALTLRSVAILQTRNHLNYSDGGINVSVSDKGPALNNMAQMLEQRYITQKNRMKSSINVELAFADSGTMSEYFTVNGIYYSNF